MKCAVSSSFSFVLPIIKRKIRGSENVILENTCCRLEIPDFFRRVENIRMKLNPKLTISSSAWLLVNFNFTPFSLF